MAEERACKVGLIACSGEEISEGTLSRVAVRLVLERMGSERTVTICLPLFMSGDAGERQFAQAHPTITVDGCGKRCAQAATEALSGPVSEAVVVSDLLAEWGEKAPASRRCLSGRDWQVASRLADRLVRDVERLSAPATGQAGGVDEASEPVCACMGGGLPRGTLDVGGSRLQLVALEPALQAVKERADLSVEEQVDELVDLVHVYNGPLEDVPQESLRGALRQALERYSPERSQG